MKIDAEFPSPEFYDFAVIIYGLFDVGGICHYVGQTMNPEDREWMHLYDRKSKFYGKGLLFRVIRETGFKDANRLERQIGRAYKRRGEAKLSKLFHGEGTVKIPRNTGVIYTGLFRFPFPNLRTAAKFLGCSPQTLKASLGKTVYCGHGVVLVDSHPIGIDWQI